MADFGFQGDEGGGTVGVDVTARGLAMERGEIVGGAPKGGVFFGIGVMVRGGKRRRRRVWVGRCIMRVTTLDVCVTVDTVPQSVYVLTKCVCVVILSLYTHVLSLSLHVPARADVCVTAIRKCVKLRVSVFISIVWAWFGVCVRVCVSVGACV